jgi:hypothetical protein
VDVLDWAFTNGCPCNPRVIFEFAAIHGKVDVLNWAKKIFPIPTNELSFIANLANVHVLTWMEKNGIPFPQNFILDLEHSPDLRIIFWAIKKKLPSEFFGIWREVEEALPRIQKGKGADVLERAKEALRDMGRVEGLIELVRERGKEF